MPRTMAQRAQQFQAFDALKGLRELLKQQEVIIVPKRILSEDDYELLNRLVFQIKVGMMIRVVYFENGQYIQLEGRVAKINFVTKMLQIVKTKINIKNLVEIELNS